MGKMWSMEEEDFLRCVYPEGGTMAFQKMFPMRSKLAVITRAHLLGVKYMSYWSKEKILYLKKVYFVGGSKAFRLKFPQVPMHIVHKKVWKLGLKRQKLWSYEEGNYLKKVYPIRGVEFFLLRFPCRSNVAVQCKANELGICCLNKGYSVRGSRSPKWNGGSSFEPYSVGFTEHLKESVRDFYGRRCLICGSVENELRLPVHHIDYNKKNHAFSNLVSLCFSCHTKTSFSSRTVWMIQLKFLQKQFYKSRIDFPVPRHALNRFFCRLRNGFPHNVDGRNSQVKKLENEPCQR